MSDVICKHGIQRSVCAQCFERLSLPVDAYLDALTNKEHMQRLVDAKDEPDYIAWLGDSLDALRNIPDDECSEEVSKTICAVIEDLGGVLAWLRGA